ncbi:hypothetical protein PVAP13_2NG358009 [Panicum virgatum]|uniref:Uncharacterized protein n=1 Tax=Panicum virgatum TaxID=38727 RepID=A0A8T0VPG6_PANVG|nr:hypothetical protein PVAP13_2NG358009 [Panicum virgatum]
MWPLSRMTTHSFPGEESDEPVHEHHGVIAAGLEEEEDMLLALGLEPLHRAAPPARREGLVVRPVPRPHQVLLRRADEDPLARKVPQARRRGDQGVHPRIVRAVRRLGERERPQLLRERRPLRRLPVDGLPPAEPRVEQDRALDPRPRRRARLAFGRGHHRDVVDDVPAGAVAGQEEAAEVAVLRQPGIPAVRDRPLERAERVLVAGRQRVLGREAVVDGDDEQAGPRGQGIEEALVHRRRRRLGDEAAAVEVDQHGELLAVGVGPGGRVREVEANVEASVAVDDDILRRDAGAAVEAGRHGGGADQAVDAPVAVDAEERTVQYDFRARIHGECGWELGSSCEW